MFAAVSPPGRPDAGGISRLFGVWKHGLTALYAVAGTGAVD